MSQTQTKLAEQPESHRLACLHALEKKVLWLSSWMIHNANHLRENRDGLKVGGHQASSASVATLMTALFFDVLRPADRVTEPASGLSGPPSLLDLDPLDDVGPVARSS